MSFPPTQQSQLQELAYSTLNNYFTNHSHETLEIEILPPALLPEHSLILEDGANLGVPKKTLALAFAHARHRFFLYKNSEVIEERRCAHQATRIMLLFDPEHLTAANFRKSHFLFNSENLPAADHRRWQFQRREELNECFVNAVWDELRFMNSILTSPLHRQSKSPTLWAHRAWWLECAFSMLPQSCDDVSAFFMAELEAVMKSGERHPKNYYAWLYARKAVRMEMSRVGEVRGHAFASVAADKVMAWCKAHPSDISGFSFLEWLIPLVDGEPEVARVVESVVEYAMNIRLANESLWTFVRISLVRCPVRSGSKEKILRSLNEYVATWEKADGGGAFLERVRETRDWVAREGGQNDVPSASFKQDAGLE
ncbi:uncharacterized protein N0V89_002299 [Didymosphaeria variabile]|uniref:Protein prenylyltransferase n=1 Tax=Didymosphaeria variabile TaxID=1932322 RepID=A0A9W8XTV6_9PLEO|nr:uncharacterized protein N0V89_002299 [Didymosphaeria variabile]KAJ4357723.1 hypothetical protein N0V89_002299 [Didymosphaeria variabile]